MAQATVKNLISSEFTDAQRLVDSGVFSDGDGVGAATADRLGLDVSSASNGRWITRIQIGDAAPDQWYCCTIEVDATSGNHTQGNFDAWTGFDEFSPLETINCNSVGTYAIYGRRSTAGSLIWRVGVGALGNEPAGSASISIKRWMIQEVADENVPPYAYAVPNMRSAFSEDNSGNSVDAGGLVTFGPGAPIANFKPEVIAVKANSFNDEPSLPEWAWYLSENTEYPFYIDAFGGRAMFTANTTLNNTLTLVDNLQAVYYPTAGTLPYTGPDLSSVVLPSLVINDLAVNDIAQGRTLEQLQGAFEDFVSISRAYRSDIPVLASNVGPWRDDAGGPSTGWTAARQTITEDYNAWLITRIAQDPLMRLNDIYTLLEDPARPGQGYINPALNNASDNIHPNAAGSEAIALQAEPLVVELFAAISFPSLTKSTTQLLKLDIESYSLINISTGVGKSVNMSPITDSGAFVLDTSGLTAGTYDLRITENKITSVNDRVVPYSIGYVEVV